MVFTEVAHEAVTRAPSSTRELGIHLVDARETRHILGRPVGYEVSPVLWRKVCVGLSVGHVRLVTARLVVEREREHMTLRSASHWGVEATFSTVLSTVDITIHRKTFLTTRLVTPDGRRAATSRDLNDDSQLHPAALKTSAVHLHQVGATTVAEAIGQGEPCAIGVENRPCKCHPATPFTTSTL